MLIKELNLIGFGKFNNKIIKLDKGINLIYGNNEDGKSTIHSFIEGMFYGFLKPYVKSTRYWDDHGKYEPWNSDRYAGIIVFEYKGIDYRIERTFTKNKEDTKVFIENTGEDITSKIDNGLNSKVLQPGIHFFGLSSVEYSNTASIKQLSSKTDVNLASEVSDKLINLNTSLDEEISIKNAINALNLSIKEIGTERALTSNYGKLSNELKTLLDEREEINSIKHEYEELLDESKSLGLRIDCLQRKLEKYKDTLSIIQYNEKKDRYDKAINIQKSLDDLQLKISKLEKYSTLSIEDYRIAQNKLNEINILTSKIEDLNIQINELESAVENYMFMTSIDQKKRNKDKKYKSIRNILVVVYIVLMYVFVSKTLLNIIAVFQFLLLLIIYLSYKIYYRDKEYIFVIEDRERQVKDNKDKVNTLKNRLIELSANVKELSKEYDSILKLNSSNNLEEFYLNLEKKKAYYDALKEDSNKKELMKQILRSSSIKELELDISQAVEFNITVIERKDVVQEKIEKHTSEITELKIMKKGVEERLNILIPKVSRLVEVEEKIQRCEDTLLELDIKKKSLELAMSTIIDLSKNIQNRFAPQINIEVGKLLEKITRGKYAGVRIDDKLNIDVVDPDSNELIDVKSLSAGTFDQLYFSLRFGIINSITTNSIPLILDDCFTQYDDYRLRNILGLLIDISENRQIIMFTCHNREADILKDLMTDFNKIALS